MNSLQAQLSSSTAQAELAGRCKTDNDSWRLRFHLMPPVGWLNDPNGLCCCNGMYHIYFQYTPFDANGGLKLWGHYQSRDLIHFEYTGVPLLPDSDLDCNGAYSGSALVEENCIHIFYTGNVKLEGDYDYINGGRISNTIWTKSHDGLAFETKKCVLTTQDYPDDLTQHVRDPKVFLEDSVYYMILGARDRSDKGLALIYASTDKQNWNYINRITTADPFGFMWECPDLFRLGGNVILSVSPQGLYCFDCHYQNKYQSGYFFVSGDFKSDCSLSEFREWDYGFDFYAPQTFLDCAGRRILIAWMGMIDCEDEYSNPTTAFGWQHTLTLPRELTLSPDGEHILQNPVQELEQLRIKEIPFQTIRADNSAPFQAPSTYELLLTDIDSTDCSITICGGLTLSYHENALFEMQFLNNCGSGRDIRRVSIDALDSLRVFVDTSAVEVFLNHGETVLSSRFYPADGHDTLQVSCASCTIQLWELGGYQIT